MTRQNTIYGKNKHSLGDVYLMLFQSIKSRSQSFETLRVSDSRLSNLWVFCKVGKFKWSWLFDAALFPLNYLTWDWAYNQVD